MRDTVSGLPGLPFLFIAALLTSASGFVITPAQTPTKTAYTPHRTQYGVGHPQRTLLPMLPKRNHEIEARKVVTWTIETCGWTSKNAYLPKTCPVGLGCGWILGGNVKNDYGVVCVPYDDSNEINWADAILPTTCYTYGQANITAGNAYSETSSSTLLCGASAKQCATAVFDGGPFLSGYSTSFEVHQFTSLFCASSSTQVQVYQTATNSILSSVPPSSSGFSSSSSSSSSLSAGPAKLPETTSPTPTAIHKSSSPNGGTIAGATIGAVAAVALVAAAVGFSIRRRKGGENHAPPEISTEFTGMRYYPEYERLQHGETSYPQIDQSGHAAINHNEYLPWSELGRAVPQSQAGLDAQERLWPEGR